MVTDILFYIIIIKSNCIIAANSCINKEIEKSNVIVASNNKIVRENINWIE